MDIPHFVYPLIDEQMDCFHFLAIINNANMNLCIQVIVCTYVFNSGGYIPRSGIAGPYGNSMFTFLRNSQASL